MSKKKKAKAPPAQPVQGAHRHTVWALYISHRNGFNLELHPSKAVAWENLAVYVRACWDEVANWEDTPAEAPADDDAAIDAYFKAHGTEWYQITAQAVTFPAE